MEVKDRKMKIEMIIHMLETAALILAIITLGKFLEGTAKKSIVNMTAQLFPQE